ncbi:type II 3-dehydroquinate dehydratase [Streptomyces griseoviridis]|jgi:5-deoxy-5-amino-3-dehydroquinate dehydratase|uniref:3-dehydroquinate dehydratase n=3 Tax=Streptomyces TaxID=1883 RepID=A0A918GWG5_STRGD|nr:MULTISPECIES: type II 3-dehydroquinate dehydratase [Streptomyces]MDP9680417.1 5-deoxy-5-amino-3-dehydroquinate dehydratase [Streptomyces griseoviridis]GGS67065.1 3-dehydroquinate dehydratase [Streptomyces niveoruber]GGT16165.1 3-dehydroquinate dehydratase [Streptomyces griseoviridis]GGU63228.1 3-dehydroquinate dehydratase [Streptomyces daghestanicus]GHI29059.1 3-dehydroquinate dehydratase [Streptomyces daghestanicus]
MSHVLLLNGPNLGTLGTRQPEIYGTTTLARIEADVAEEVSSRGWTLVAEQRNGEGELIELLQQHGDAVGALVNPGALMIAGWGLRDALEDFAPPWIEVHLSNVWARESFRHMSVTAPLAAGVVMGLGALGYRVAAQALTRLVPPAAGPD